MKKRERIRVKKSSENRCHLPVDIILMKRIIDSRYLFTIGGISLVIRKWFHK